jgi:hypothetical protein
METFVVRVWRSTGDPHVRSPELDLPLRGLVEHVGSTKPLPFQSGGELLGILESRLLDAAPPKESLPITRSVRGAGSDRPDGPRPGRRT